MLEVGALPADERFVFLISDANLGKAFVRRGCLGCARGKRSS